jgi:signal transduction histidine kinase
VGFIIAGTVGGALASAQRAATRRHQQAAAALQAANAELRASHEQLVRADRLSSLGEIAAGLAHEVRNPLASVKGALEIIGARARENSPEAEFGLLASHEIERVQKLISEFLAYAKPHEPQRRDADIFEVLDPVLTLLAGEAERHAVTLEVRRAPVPAVSVDPEQIAQVFFNVVLNAVQVTPSRGRVAITATPDFGSRMLAVDVQDEGPGIRPDHMAKIFDPFFSTKKSGTGLGLSISQRIVQGHDGTIDIVQPGRGTVVRVRLPLAPVGRMSSGFEASA